MKRLTLTLGPIVLAAVLAACSGTSAAADTSPVPAGSPSGDAVTVVAKDLKFATPTIAAKAGSRVHHRLRQPGRRPAQHRDLGSVRGQGVQGRHRRRQAGRLPGPGADRRHIQLHLRGPSRHEGHAHRRVASDASSKRARPVAGASPRPRSQPSSGSNRPGVPPACQKTTRRPSSCTARTRAMSPASALAV